MEPEYPDIPFKGPPRSYSSAGADKRYVAIHNTANDASTSDEAAYAKVRTDGVSSHYYVDATSLVQSLRTEYRAHHAGSSTGNTYAIAYEITGTNSKSRAWWLANVQWDLLARQIARDCKRWGIVPRTLTIAQMKDGHTSGIVTHDQMRQAWGGTTHTDPGPGFPLDYLIERVQQYMEGDDVTEAEMIAACRKAMASMADEAANRSTPTGKQYADDVNVMMQNAGLRTLTVKVDAIAADVKTIVDAVTAASGEIPPDIAAQLAAINAQLGQLVTAEHSAAVAMATGLS